MTIVEVFAIIQEYINKYGWSILFAFGSIGCLLNICLFSRRCFRTTSCCLYFLAASVAMLIVFCIGIIPLIHALNHPYVYSTISSFCKSENYLMTSSTMIYRWLMVAACIDRYLNTSINFHRQQMLDIHLTVRIIVIIVIIWLILSIDQIIWTDIKDNVCLFTNSTAETYNSFLMIITGGILPVLIMIVCALLIQRNLAIKRDRLIRLRHTNKQQEQNRLLLLQDRQALLMLYVQIFVYIISTTPWTVSLIYTALSRQVLNSATDIGVQSFVIYVTLFISYMYPVLSFYMYTLASRTFRRELTKMLRTIFVCRCQCPFIAFRGRIEPKRN